MSEACKKKKQPEVVRAHLMEAAAEITIERGLPGLTLDRVARRAGVSKGGLIHHYPNKQALVRGLFQHVLDLFEGALQQHIAEDPCPRSRFTRAYLAVTVQLDERLPSGKLFGACALAMSLEKTITTVWKDWLRDRLTRYGEDPACPVREMARLTADGVWVADCTGASSLTSERRKALKDHLMAMVAQCEDEPVRQSRLSRGRSPASAPEPRIQGAPGGRASPRPENIKTLCSMLLVAHFERGRSDLVFDRRPDVADLASQPASR